MKAITIRNPYAWVIAETAALTALGVAPKTVENRGRPVADQHIGQDIAIHAGLAWSEEGEADQRVRHAWRTFAEAIDLREPNPKLAAIGDTRTGYVGRLQDGLWIERRAVVAVATLADCHEAKLTGRKFGTEPCCAPWGENSYNGKQPAYHLVLDNVRRLREPVACAGKLWFPWDLPEPVAEQVEQQLLAVTR